MAQTCRKSIREGAAHFRAGRGQTTAPVGQPDASRLAEADGQGKTCRRVEGAGGKGANHRDQFEDFPESESQRPPGERTTTNGSGELTERCWRPSHVVAGRKCAQHDREYASKTTYTNNRERSCTRTRSGGAIAIDQWTGSCLYAITFGIDPRKVHFLERGEAGLLKDTPKPFDPKLRRRKTVFGYGEIDRCEAWPGPGQSIKQPTLEGERLPQGLRQGVVGFVLRPARIRVWVWMPRAGSVETMQAGLRDDDRPVEMSSPRMPNNLHHGLLHGIGHLHCDQQQV
jgi:hypothetical protein